MILTPDERTRRFLESGAWSRVTLDQVFRKMVAADPSRIAFRDVAPPPVPGLGAAYSYGEAARRVDALAAFFAGVGMKPDMVLGIHLPPCADAAIIVLAAMRAGLVVCPLPVEGASAELQTMISAAGVKAIVTSSTLEGDTTGERVRDVAAEVFAIRFVFAVGSGVPDGLIDLAEVLADLDALGPPPEVQRRGSAADHVALLGIARGEDERLVVVPFSHNHLVAIGIAHLLEARISRGETLLVTHHPAGLAGVGSLVTGLIAGSTIGFLHVLSLAGLIAAAAEMGPGRAIVPASIGPALAAGTTDALKLSLVGTGAKVQLSVGPGRDAVDLLTFGGLTLLPVARDEDGGPMSVPAGAVSCPRGSDGPVFFETRIKPRIRAGARRPTTLSGEFLLNGPIIPDAPWPEAVGGKDAGVLAFGADGALRTGLLAEASAEGAPITVRGPLGDGIEIAGRFVSPARLDAICRRHPMVSDAAVFPIAHDLIGHRLGAAVVLRDGCRLEPDELTKFLAAEGCHPVERPSLVISVRELPRGADGAVMREALFATLAA